MDGTCERGNGVPYQRCAFAGDDPNTAWLWGNNGALAARNLNSATPTLKDLSGNLSDFSSPAVGNDP
ncbi:MAG: hypothetical protein IPK17_38460 [Chloroflexi bacterium]|uniref:hypothetical protein n=1 Tax=Candidatus Flexifilum breve TaxID=3140694 RepID=UPI0031374829|nr:hypothetical protein [Chloroflexota bacterium]